MIQLNRESSSEMEPVMTDHEVESPSSIIFIHSSLVSLEAISSKST